ncbi:hypothetical protein IJI31_02980 [bacterium]|nr:hypothetical protein [bacterium]
MTKKIKKLIVLIMLIVFSAPACLAVISRNIESNVKKPIDATVKIDDDICISKDNPKINMSLRNSDVRQVLRMLADKAGLNIMFHDSVEGNVTLDLVNMPLNQAFKLVLQLSGLNYFLDTNTLIITKGDGEGANFSKQEIGIIPIKNRDAIEIADFLNGNVYSIGKPGFSSSEAAIVNADKNELIIFGTESDIKIAKKVVAQFDKPQNSRTYIVNHTTPQEMAKLICGMLEPNFSTGGAAGVMTGGADEIKIGENKIACTISKQMSKKGEGLTSLGKTNLVVSYFPQRGTINVIGGSEYQMQQIEEFIKQNDVKQPQAYLEVSFLELSEDGSKTFANIWSMYGGSPFVVNFSGGTTTVRRDSPSYSDLTYHFITYDPTTGMPTQQDVTLSTLNKLLPMRISWAMNYILENKKGKVLSNPKILITNGEESTIDLTGDYIKSSKAEYLTSTSTGGTSVGATQRTYDIGSDLGIKVNLTPFISPEGYVTLNIEPDYTTERSTVLDDAGNIVATLLQRRNLKLSNVRIKDNETLIIGGMMKESETKTVNKIPVLGDVPVIGAIFRSTATKKVKEEMVIMLTPRIIKENSDMISSEL